MFPYLSHVFLLCSRGVFDIYVQKDGANVCVGKYDSKGSFGELALMYNTPRAATIIASQDGALWGLVSRQNKGGCYLLYCPFSFTNHSTEPLRHYK